MPDEDDEPKKKRFSVRTGTKCWFISSTGRWHLVLATPTSPGYVRIESVLGYCDTRVENWPYPTSITIKRASATGDRLRPLSERVCNTSM